MKLLVILLTLTYVTLSASLPHGGYGASLYGDHISPHDYYAPAYYDFGYAVKDPYHGTNFGHQESRNGHLTTGEYFVHLPDGRIQKVSYYADEHGYHPTVTYIGKAHFPPSKGHYY